MTNIFSYAVLLIASLFATIVSVFAEPATTNRPPPFAKGTITELDQLHKLMTIRTKKQRVLTFGWTDRTYIFLGKQKLTPDKLQVGDDVAIRHYPAPDGSLLVQRMKVYRDGHRQRLEPDPLPDPLPGPSPTP